jgi:hypothetical protein
VDITGKTQFYWEIVEGLMEKYEKYFSEYFS